MYEAIKIKKSKKHTQFLLGVTHRKGWCTIRDKLSLLGVRDFFNIKDVEFKLVRSATDEETIPVVHALGYWMPVLPVFPKGTLNVRVKCNPVWFELEWRFHTPGFTHENPVSSCKIRELYSLETPMKIEDAKMPPQESTATRPTVESLEISETRPEIEPKKRQGKKARKNYTLLNATTKKILS